MQGAHPTDNKNKHTHIGKLRNTYHNLMITEPQLEKSLDLNMNLNLKKKPGVTFFGELSHGVIFPWAFNASREAHWGLAFRETTFP